jgi:hypothetical protein
MSQLKTVKLAYPDIGQQAFRCVSLEMRSRIFVARAFDDLVACAFQRNCVEGRH